MNGANPSAVLCKNETRSVSISLSPADIIARSTSVLTSSRPSKLQKKKIKNRKDNFCLPFEMLATILKDFNFPDQRF